MNKKVLIIVLFFAMFLAFKLDIKADDINEKDCTDPNRSNAKAIDYNGKEYCAQKEKEGKT